jgi:hypothetical protein
VGQAMNIVRTIALTALFFAPLVAEAQGFSANSEAESWNLYAEQPARFEAKVVDILCEITGDCPADCGAGKRQLGLLRTVDQALVYPNKNGQPSFLALLMNCFPIAVNRSRWMA